MQKKTYIAPSYEVDYFVTSSVLTNISDENPGNEGNPWATDTYEF